ncbi:unnamed protein product, partial [Ectocarpus fasciculatus]
RYCLGGFTSFSPPLSLTPLCVCPGLSRVLADINVPIVGYSLKDAELADWYNYQNVLRTNPLETSSVFGAADIAQHHDWRRVSVMHSEDGARYGGYSQRKFLQFIDG